VLSGFLVTKSYLNTSSLKKYFVKRAKRILPAYLFVVFFAALSLVFFSKDGFCEYFSDVNVYKYLGWNFVFLNFMHPCLPGLFENNLMCVVNGSLWTLKVEEGFYIILPLIFYTIKKYRTPILILISVYFLSIAYSFMMNFYFNKPLLAKQLPGYLSYFVTGIILYLNFQFVLKHRIKLLIIASLLLFFSFFLNLRIDVFYPFAFGTIVIILAYSMPFFNNFGRYGDFTYGIYIYHFPIIQLFKQYDLFEKHNPLIMAILVIILTLLLAVFSWFVIEKRFLDRYNKKPKVIAT
jgi:peptidoglycan/LPS O-acetylase OafA/YrhL